MVGVRNLLDINQAIHGKLQGVTEIGHCSCDRYRRLSPTVQTPHRHTVVRPLPPTVYKYVLPDEFSEGIVCDVEIMLGYRFLYLSTERGSERTFKFILEEIPSMEIERSSVQEMKELGGIEIAPKHIRTNQPSTDNRPLLWLNYHCSEISRYRRVYSS